MTEPRVLVFSSLFPSAAAPTAGTFIRERMFRVARRMPLLVVAPQASSPLDPLIRLRRSSFRPRAQTYEEMDGIAVYRPRVLSVPGIAKRLDGRLMALGARSLVARLVREFRPTVIDAHFLYPDGYAASLLAREHRLPMTVTLRGSKDAFLIGTSREPYLRATLAAATRVLAVSDSLRTEVAGALGYPPERVEVVGNGVDLRKFSPVDRAQARNRLDLPDDAQVMIGVGGLVPVKGFHRVIALLPALRAVLPRLRYLIVGGGTTQADMGPELRALAQRHQVADIVRFCGPKPQGELRWYYGAADLYVHATAAEGWANVFLEAMACGLPVITTDVGGNREVVSEPGLGTLVPYWDPQAFAAAIIAGFGAQWDRQRLIAHARANLWDQRIDRLETIFRELSAADNYGEN